MTQVNARIINEFERLIKQVQFDIDNSVNRKQQMVNMFRLQSIKTVLKIIKDFPTKITSSDQLRGIKGIGKGSVARIDEILKTGKLSEVKDEIVTDTYSKYIDELEKVFGIGRKTAILLYKKYNIKSINDLKKMYKAGKIELTDNIIKGLKHYDEISDKIPRAEMDLINNILQDILYSIDIKLFGIICGSYRRLKPFSGDVDMLIIHPSYKSKKSPIKINYLSLFINKLKKEEYLVESFTDYDVASKFMGLFRLSPKHPIRRLDVRFIPYESYYYALLYFTGSGEFNKRMRQIAIDNGYTLNEYGLYDEKGKSFKVKCEKEIFELLGMEYVDPEKRT